MAGKKKEPVLTDAGVEERLRRLASPAVLRAARALEAARHQNQVNSTMHLREARMPKRRGKKR